ncbi:hypothetical protein COCON_G00047940 [Conger conger]|uniref:Cystatin domain-containing protein n=1 Tax=Conger conger TaxID=82655 RepID=A0A9Q1DUY8_CONCO|nr:cystatin-like [Conger conger]KAJ8282275.1 hypothetical protein COCON_G00047940 [Conger conger]
MTGILQFLCTLLFSSLVVALPPGAVVDVDSNNHEVQACASFALGSFNEFNKDPHLYVITKFFSVKMANIGGGEYNMEVEVRKTKCLKGSKADPSSCNALIDPEAKPLRCNFVVLSTPWKDMRTLIQSSCAP